MEWSNFNRFNRQKDVRIRKIDDEFYIICKNYNYKCNEMGALILQQIGRDMDRIEFGERFRKKYLLDDDVNIDEDIDEYVHFLMEEKLIFEC